MRLVLVFIGAALGSELAAPSPPRRQRPAWQSKLSTYSIASVAKREGRSDWNEVTQGNKIVLPREVLDYLIDRGLPYDKFQLLNPQSRETRLFTGPLDFCAASGECYLPTWVMKQLGIKQGETCAVATACFPNCAFVKFQPHTSDFLDIGDHYTVLTRTMENMGGLTQGSYVRVSDGRRTYTLDVLEVRGKPSQLHDDSNGMAVAIGTFECPVEFAEPKDLVKKKKKKPTAGGAEANDVADGVAAAAEAKGSGTADDGSSQTGGSADHGAGASKRRARKAAAVSPAAVTDDTAAAGKPVPKFKRRKAAEAKGETLDDGTSAFSGKARTLGGDEGTGENGPEALASASDAEPSTGIAKARAKAKTAKQAKEAEAAAAAEAAAKAAEEARPPTLVLAEKLLELFRSIVKAVLSLVRQLLMPSDVNFD
jgi:ubiquitin fusion degradation protein 1